MELNHNYREQHLQSLYNMREQDQLCDVTIHVGGRKFRAHKTVLAATGHYFLTMFTAGFRESSAHEISIEGSAAAFEILLNFVYTGKVDHTKLASCVSEVLEMACYMQFTAFIDTCSAAVQKLLKATTEAFPLSDVCKVMWLAKTHDMTPVYQDTLRYLEDKVESLKCLDMFLENISATFLEDFLCEENLSNADEEEHVLELVMNWLKHDWEKRKEHSHQLLQKVRLGLVATEDIKKLIGAEILNISGCSELVNRALDLHASKKSKEILAVENPDIAAARSTVMAPVILNDDCEFEYFDAKDESWIAMKKMDPLPSTCRSRANIYELIAVDGVLYAAGGANGKEFLKYQTSENKWLPLPSKPLGIKRIKLVTLGAYIYAFSACCDPRFRDHMIERYDINAEKWEVLTKVKENSNMWSRTSKRFTLVAEEMDTTRNMRECSYSCAADDKRRREIFAVVFEEKIFVSSLNQDNTDNVQGYYGEFRESLYIYTLEEELAIFDPVTNTYQIEVLDNQTMEEESGEWDHTCFKPTLFVHDDQLYWMMTKIKDDDYGEESSVTVQKLSITQEDSKIKVTFCHSELETIVDLDHLSSEPFYIQDNIFVKPSEVPRSLASRPGRGKIWMPRHHKVKSSPKYGENKQLMNVCGDRVSYPVWFLFEKKLTV